MVIKEDQETIKQYTFDASNHHGDTDKVYIPDNINDLSDLLKKLNKSKKPITIAGSGTGLTGGRVPYGSSVLSTERFKDLVFADGILSCGTGCTWKQADEYAGKYGYFIGPNPTEYSSSIGGNINTNASGSRTFKYGSFRDVITSLSGVWSNGAHFTIGRGDYIEADNIIPLPGNAPVAELNIDYIAWPDTKNATGYKLVKGTDLIDLLVGSEGTLAVLTECLIRCEPLPNNIIGFIGFFDDQVKVLDFVQKLKNDSSLKPRLIEYFDDNSLNIQREKYNQVPDKAKSAIWTEFEINSDKVSSIEPSEEEIMAKVYDLISQSSKIADESWFAQNDKDHRFFAEFRHYLPERIYEDISENRNHKLGTDSAVPDKSFSAYFKKLHDDIAESEINHVIFGHIGNNHLHANMFPTEEQHEKSLDIYENLMREAISLKGTISAEHGIGKIKRRYFQLMYSEKDINSMIAVKKALDPQGILNPGNLFDL
jgi:D-lactate dehydrogenase (cytochrome)